MAQPYYQRAEDESVDRNDHVWTKDKRGYVCVLCWAIAHQPPNYPTPTTWSLPKYRKLTDQERKKCPQKQRS